MTLPEGARFSLVPVRAIYRHSIDVPGTLGQVHPRKATYTVKVQSMSPRNKY